MWQTDIKRATLESLRLANFCLIVSSEILIVSHCSSHYIRLQLYFQLSTLVCSMYWKRRCSQEQRLKILAFVLIKKQKQKILAFALYIDVYPTKRPQPSWSENKAKESINKKNLKKIQIKGKMNREKNRGLIYQIINNNPKKKKSFLPTSKWINTHGVKLKTVKWINEYADEDDRLKITQHTLI